LAPEKKKLKQKDIIKVLDLLIELGDDLCVASSREYSGKKVDKYYELVNSIK